MKQLIHAAARAYATTTFVVAMLMCGKAIAQNKQDTLAPVKVRGDRKFTNDRKLEAFSTGQHVVTIDSSALAQYTRQNIATLLDQRLPVFVKSYSFNGLATVSFRGASAAQSLVMWNGVPIQNAALGMADIGSVSTNMVSRLNIVYGGSAALYGSGNTGGALMLESSTPIFDTNTHQLSLGTGMGSFGRYSGNIAASISRRRWFLSGSAFVQTARNDYLFTNISGTDQRMTNSRLDGKAVTINGAYKSGGKDIVQLHLWAQQYDREIPPALFEQTSLKQQQDAAFRSVAEWQHKDSNHRLYARSSFTADRISYTDDAVQLSSKNHVYQYYQEAGWEQAISRNGRLLVFFPATLAWVRSPFSGKDSLGQYRAAIAMAYTHKLLNERLAVSAQTRAEYVNTNSIVLPGCGAAYDITGWLQLQVNAQRTYRLPTLNELYYFPGGNTMLKPEEGWTEDAGYKLHLQKGRMSFYHEATVFNRQISNWILWFGGAIWTPHNIARVHSRGTETSSKATFTMGKWTIHCSLVTAYYLSTTSASDLPNDGSIGRQIPYAPRYNARLNVGFTIGRLWLNYNHTYTGYRFTTTDESAWLEPYQTGNLQVAYKLLVNKHTLSLSAQCNNIWNARYSVTANRPMPGINWLGGLTISLK